MPIPPTEGLNEAVTTTVVHCKKEPYDIYIGRPSKWGNPYKIGPDGDRTTVITKFENWVNGFDPVFLQSELMQLKDKVLGCYCAPLACHGDVLARLADAL